MNDFMSLSRDRELTTSATPDVEVFFPWKDGTVGQRVARMMRWIERRTVLAVVPWRIVIDPCRQRMALYHPFWKGGVS